MLLRLARAARRAIGQYRLRRGMQRFYGPLDLASAFDHVYANGMWGGRSSGDLYSGDGSRGSLASAYCAMMAPEIAARSIRTVADIGCGDFRIGAELAAMVDDYTGIDVSPRVVAINQERHAGPGRRFLRADATSDPLPSADAAVVRQVLQHLSNAEISRALGNLLRTYPIVFITEHVHEQAESRPNRDMAHGAHTRVEDRSGVLIDRAPFNVAGVRIGDIPVLPRQFLRSWVVER